MEIYDYKQLVRAVLKEQPSIHFGWVVWNILEESEEDSSKTGVFILHHPIYGWWGVNTTQGFYNSNSVTIGVYKINRKGFKKVLPLEIPMDMIDLFDYVLFRDVYHMVNALKAPNYQGPFIGSSYI